MLVAKGLKKSYDNKEVFSDIDIQIESGTISFLLGPSGSGKSTLLRLLAFLETPDAGSISISDPECVAKVQQGKEPWPDITTVFQQLFLWPHLTLRENILLPIRKRKSKSEQNRILESLVASFAMAEFIDRYPNQASGGQRQRVAIARAIALEPKYILLDEVTSAIDFHQVANVQVALEDLLAKGTGIMAITHSLGFAEYFLNKNSAGVGQNKYHVLANGKMIIKASSSLDELRDKAVVDEFVLGLS